MEEARPRHPFRRLKPSKTDSSQSKFELRRGLTELEKTKKSRPKNENGSAKYEMLKKTDYTEGAYRDAVSRLRYLLNESYVSPPAKYPVGGYNNQEGSDEESGASSVATDRTRKTRLSSFRRPYLPERLSKNVQHRVQSSHYYKGNDSENANQSSGTPELMAFVERQEEYIDQLEKEAQYCRDELSNLLEKVKELISENETLQEQQKTGLMKVMLEDVNAERGNEFQSPKKFRKQLEGPLIVFESRISELEAQLTQSKMDLRKAQEETDYYKKKLEDSRPSSSNYDFYKQIENLQREKRDLNESLAKLQASINQIREKEIDASKKVQRTLDVVDKTQFEKQQAEMEVYRLKSELELQHDKLLEVLSEQTRKVADERSQSERRHHQHIERLNAELSAERDALSKMHMEVEKHQRIGEDLKRDLNSKNLTIENLKKELNNKIANLQKELSAVLAERDSLEQELNSSKMSSERIERLGKQESNRLLVEISSLKKRLDGGDADLIHCRRENLRHLEKISELEKELMLYKIKLGEEKDPVEDAEQNAREKLMNTRMSDIEAKHVEKVSDLEGLIENQSQVMAQLKAECQSLTQKLEESTARHKQEMESLRSRLKTLDNKMDSNFAPVKSPPDGIESKEPESVTNKKNESQTFAKENNYDETPVTVNQQNGRFLNKESRQNSASAFDSNHTNEKTEPELKSLQTINSDFGYGTASGLPAVEADKSNGKQEENQNSLFSSRSNDYSNYANSQQPFLNYQEPQFSSQDHPSTLSQQQSSNQEQIPFQDRQPFCGDEKLFQEKFISQEKLSYQEKQLASEQPSYKEQPSYNHPDSSPTFSRQPPTTEQPPYQEKLLYNHPDSHPTVSKQPSYEEKQFPSKQPSYQEQLPYNHPDSHPTFSKQAPYEEKQFPSKQPSYQEQPSYNRPDSHPTFSQQPSHQEKQLPSEQPSYQEQLSYNRPNSNPTLSRQLSTTEQPPDLEQLIHPAQPYRSERSPHQEPSPSLEQSSHKEHPNSNEQITYQKEVLQQEQTLSEESYNTRFNIPINPASASSIETFESVPPELKQPIPEPKAPTSKPKPPITAPIYEPKILVPEPKAPIPELNSSMPVPKTPISEPKSSTPVPKTPISEPKTSIPEPKAPIPQPKARVPEPKTSVPESKPTTPETPKTTPSQRFQRAAELSRQPSRSEDSSRGRLSSQGRGRTSQLSRNPARPQSRFK